jgi:Family of unknown function (DUF5372)
VSGDAADRNCVGSLLLPNNFHSRVELNAWVTALSPFINCARSGRLSANCPGHASIPSMVRRAFAFLPVRQRWSEDRVYFLRDSREFSLPAGWADAAETDAFVTMAAGRSAFRFTDLVELFDRWVIRLTDCKDNYADTVT